jgi:hypothetical protein
MSAARIGFQTISAVPAPDFGEAFVRPRKTSMHPVKNLMAEWLAEGLPMEHEAHYLAVARAIERELEGASILQLGAAAAWLSLYRRAREDSSGGALSAARSLAELVRAGRALGLVRVLEPGRMPRRRLLREIPRARAAGDPWGGDGEDTERGGPGNDAGETGETDEREG